MEPDAGLDSVADLSMLTRMLLAGLVAMVVVGVVAFIISGEWIVVLLIVGAYAAIAGTQWVAAAKRVQRTRSELAQRDGD
jgi:membrane protein implicated in regulation of membrane protease activity